MTLPDSLLHQARVDLAAKITAQGLRAVTDVRDVNAPCVLVGLPGAPTPLTRRNACSIAGPLHVTAIAPPPGNDDATAWCLAVVELLSGVIGWTEAVPSTWSAGGPTSSDQPAYTMTVPIHT